MIYGLYSVCSEVPTGLIGWIRHYSSCWTHYTASLRNVLPAASHCRDESNIHLPCHKYAFGSSGLGRWLNDPLEKSNPTQVEYFKDIVGTIREPLLVLDARRISRPPHKAPWILLAFLLSVS